jgi:hypothetical protein
MAAQTVIEHIQTGTDSIEIGDFKRGRIKIHFTPEESANEQRANEHIDRIARLRQRTLMKLRDTQAGNNEG